MNVSVKYETVNELLKSLKDFNWETYPVKHMFLSDIFSLYSVYRDLKELHDACDFKHYESVMIDSGAYIALCDLRAHFDNKEV
ncbi:hypothetical protein ASwh1_96 [Aeromonas phage Aswh_1]|nr:hypothetical protein ASwh1_96 [Aeromonas phage Aswh_1]